MSEKRKRVNSTESVKSGTSNNNVKNNKIDKIKKNDQKQEDMSRKSSAEWQPKKLPKLAKGEEVK